MTPLLVFYNVLNDALSMLDVVGGGVVATILFHHHTTTTAVRMSGDSCSGISCSCRISTRIVAASVLLILLLMVWMIIMLLSI